MKITLIDLLIMSNLITLIKRWSNKLIRILFKFILSEKMDGFQARDEITVILINKDD